VLVAWIPMLAPDVNPEVADLLADERAKHYWDGERRLGRYVGRLLGNPNNTAWDIFLVYPPDANWGDPPDSSGDPVINEAGRLERALSTVPR
jgi:hypothetical protein